MVMVWAGVFSMDLASIGWDGGFVIGTGLYPDE